MMRRFAGLSCIAITILACIAVPATARSPAVQGACWTIDKTQVAALFDKWNRALLTKRSAVVVAEYAADATLLPTVKTGPLIGSQAIGAYFDTFLKQSPQATVEERIVRTGCNIAYDIGLYTFLVDGDQPTARTQVKARYTFIYAPVRGQWLIVHHHSSAVP